MLTTEKVKHKKMKKGGKYSQVSEVSCPNWVEMVPLSSPWLNRSLIDSPKKAKLTMRKDPRKIERGKWQKNSQLQHLSIQGRGANHPILATKINVGIPVQDSSVGQPIPNGDKGILIRSLGTKSSRRRKRKRKLVVC